MNIFEKKELCYGGDYNPEQWIDYDGVWDEDIRLMSVADIDDFYNNSYSHINGSLYVGVLSSYHHEGIEIPEVSDYSYKYFWPWDLNDISKLSGLVEVTEGLYMANTQVSEIMSAG